MSLGGKKIAGVPIVATLLKATLLFFPKLLKQRQTKIKIQPVVKSYFPFVTELLKRALRKTDALKAEG